MKATASAPSRTGVKASGPAAAASAPVATGGLLRHSSAHMAGLLMTALVAWAAVAECWATPPALTLSAEGEQFRAFDQDGPLTRSAITSGLRLTYDDRVHVHGALDVRWCADRILPERDRAYVAEGYLGLASGPLELVLGRQTVRWGRLDSLRPTDIFRRRSLIDPLEDRDEPIWVARLDLFAGPATLEALFVPLFEPDRLSYDDRNPWCLFPDSVEVPDVGTVPASFSEGQRLAPAEDITSAQYGLRLDLRAGAWDLGTCAGQAHDRVPTVLEPADSTLLRSGRAHVQVDAAYAELFVAGVDLARSLGTGTLRAEAARIWPQAVAGRAAEPVYTRAGVGIDQVIRKAGLGKDLTVLLQYTYDEAAHGAEGVAGYRHLLRHGGVARLRLEPGHFTRLDVESLVDLERWDRFTKIELAWSLHPGWSILAGLLLVDGDPDGLLGRFAEHDRLRVQMRYGWSVGGR